MFNKFNIADKIVIFAMISAFLSVFVVGVYNYMYGSLEIFKNYLAIELIVAKLVSFLYIATLLYQIIKKEKITKFDYFVLGFLGLFNLFIWIVFRYLL